MTSYGTVERDGNFWKITTQPQVIMMLQRLFIGARRKGRTLRIAHNNEAAENIAWILDRWHHDIAPPLLYALRATVKANHARRAAAESLLRGEVDMYEPVGWNPDCPLRDYQLTAVALAKLTGTLLIGDDLGLGKTATGIGVIADGNTPALVVCDAHLQTQWVNQLAKFCPKLRTHIVKKRAPYTPAPHDVTVITYAKLDAWDDALPWKTVIYDEVQSLRKLDTNKYCAAQNLATTTSVRVGLSATPIYNNAGETYAIFDALSPGSLGTAAEFEKEWGAQQGNNWRVEDPVALGAYLRDRNLYIRRTRREVGRELPPVTRINERVEHHKEHFERLKLQCNELAQKVLSGGFHERGQAGRILDLKLRQATGIAKAPFVADFVRAMVEAGESVVLGGWHREVYEVWQRDFDRTGEGRAAIPWTMYTGSESGAEKDRAKRAFVEGEAKVMILSLRSGAGLDGLQTVSSAVVFGELDYSPKVHEQFTGRLQRDGQCGPVTEIYLTSDAGSDPIIMGILASKWQQSTAVTDPDLLDEEIKDEQPAEAEGRITAMAREWLAQQKRH